MSKDDIRNYNYIGIIFTVMVSYNCVISNVKNSKIDGICWSMIFMVIGNFGWAVGASIMNETEGKLHRKKRRRGTVWS